MLQSHASYHQKHHAISTTHILNAISLTINTPYSTLITSYNVHISEYRHNKKPCKDSGKALYSIHIHVISDSCYYHITPFSVQYPIFMNDIPDTCHCKSNQHIPLYKTPFDNMSGLGNSLSPNFRSFFMFFFFAFLHIPENIFVKFSKKY